MEIYSITSFAMTMVVLWANSTDSLCMCIISSTLHNNVGMFAFY